MKEIEAFRAKILPLYQNVEKRSNIVEPVFKIDEIKEAKLKRERKQGQISTPKELCEKYKLSYYLFREFMCRSEVVDFIAQESNKGMPTLLYDNQHLALEIKMHFDGKGKRYHKWNY